MDSLKGKLLVAAPGLADPNFKRTVVLIGEHGPEGALGLVLNRELGAATDEVVPDLDVLVPLGSQLHVGGPVNPQALIVLAEFDDPTAAGILAWEDIGVPAASYELAQIAELTRRTRAFAGFSGWGPGQLDGEIEREDWIVTDPRREEIFCEDPDALWSQVLHRMAGPYRLLARMPDDPSLN